MKVGSRIAKNRSLLLELLIPMERVRILREVIWLYTSKHWEFTWLVVGTPTPLKNHGVRVSWDDEIPN